MMAECQGDALKTCKYLKAMELRVTVWFLSFIQSYDPLSTVSFGGVAISLQIYIKTPIGFTLWQANSHDRDDGWLIEASIYCHQVVRPPKREFKARQSTQKHTKFQLLHVLAADQPLGHAVAVDMTTYEAGVCGCGRKTLEVALYTIT